MDKINQNPGLPVRTASGNVGEQLGIFPEALRS